MKLSEAYKKMADDIKENGLTVDRIYGDYAERFPLWEASHRLEKKLRKAAWKAHIEEMRKAVAG